MEIIICQQCGFKNKGTAANCQSCGSTLGITCAECAEWNPRVLNYCMHCSAVLNKDQSMEVSGSDAERRYLNVMFCDLVGSTALSESLDPEELRDIVVAYQDRCVQAVEEQGGYIAQYLGDGILVYFGYPKTHEDESQRAVKAGLKIIENISDLNNELVKSGRPPVSVRVGIHSGLVVIGDIGWCFARATGTRRNAEYRSAYSIAGAGCRLDQRRNF
jgi:hypothetical protein